MKTKLVENRHGHGAIKRSPIHRFIRRTFKKKLGRSGEPFNWSFPLNNTTKIKIKDQGVSSSCGGQAGSYFLEVMDGVVISAKSVYAPIAYPGGGTTVTALESQIGARGANLEISVPSYDANGVPLSEHLMTERSWQNEALRIDAENRAGYMPLSVDLTINAIAEAIRDHGAVIFEIQGQNNGTWLSPYPVHPTRKSKEEIWAHFVCAIGAQVVNGRKQIDFLNSWGTDVGDIGVQHLTEEYINSGYLVDAFTFIPDSQVTPGMTNKNIWANLVRYFRRKWNMLQLVSIN